MTDEVEVLEQPQEIEVSMEDTIRETYRSMQDQERDESGKFSKADQDTPIEEAQTDLTAEPVIARKAPSSWKKEAQDLYGKLPDEYRMLQDEVERREADFHKGIEGYKTKAQFAESMERVIEPHRQTLQSLGVTPDVAVHHLLEADRVLRYSAPEQKRQYLNQLAKSYGIDLQQQQDETYQAPQDTRVDAVINYLREQEQRRQQQEMATLNSDIAKFSEGKEYFEEVRNDMAGLLQAGMATSLQEAYDKAIYANQTVRDRVLAQQQAIAEQTRQAEAKKQAEAARKASATNIPRRGTIAPRRPTGSMDDTIRAEAERLGLL